MNNKAKLITFLIIAGFIGSVVAIYMKCPTNYMLYPCVWSFFSSIFTMIFYDYEPKPKYLKTGDFHADLLKFGFNTYVMFNEDVEYIFGSFSINDNSIMERFVICDGFIKDYKHNLPSKPVKDILDVEKYVKNSYYYD
jgi:hypothetical protein